MARERGSVTMWVAGVTMLAMVVALVLAHTAVAGSTQGRAQGIADLAALAGVEEGRAVAASIARRNGGLLESYAELDGRVDVTIRFHDAVADASAELGNAPGDPAGVGWGELPPGENVPLDSLRGVQPP